MISSAVEADHEQVILTTEEVKEPSAVPVVHKKQALKMHRFYIDVDEVARLLTKVQQFC